MTTAIRDEPEHDIVVDPEAVIHSVTGRDFGRCRVRWYPVTRNLSFAEARHPGTRRETPWRHQAQRIRL